MSRPVTLAAAAYPVERLADWVALEAKLRAWVGSAVTEGADIAVLPEYAGLEAALIGGPKGWSAADYCWRAAEQADRYTALCAQLAAEGGLYLLGGSLPCDTGRGLVNRAHFHAPDGAMAFQDKQVLTPWERDHTPLRAGQRLTALETEFGRIGILICYDSEFPALAAALSPDLLLIPSCTDAIAGQTRVRIAARARALEGQCVSLHAPLLGRLPDCPLIDENIGTAGVFGPPDTGFPEDGVLAAGEPDRPGWTCAEVAEGALSQTRNNGAVAPLRHREEAGERALQVAIRDFGRNRP